MKIKQLLHITNTLKFSKGEMNHFALMENDCSAISGWECCGEVEFEVGIDTGKVAESAMADIETKQKEVQLAFTEKMAQLDQAKQELLCIGNDGVDNE